MPRLASVLAAAGLLSLLAVGVASHVGARGPLEFRLNLGPGDSPYIQGFHPDYEIVNKVATHWTRYDATAKLPLTVSGGPVTATYRFARVFSETAQVEVAIDGQLIDQFSCRGGQYLKRQATVTVMDGPLAISIVSDSHEREDKGLKMDWLRFDLGAQARVRLTGWARWQPLFLSLVLLGTLAGVGWSVRSSLSLSLLCTLPLSVALLQNPWLSHRYLHGWSVALPLFGVFLIVLNRFWSVRSALTLMLAAFLIRSLLVSHPDFYYPDLRTHARLVGFVHDAGGQFLVSPSSVIADHGVWVTGALGKTYAFPYTPVFHLPFAVLDIAYDDLLTTLKLATAALSTISVALVWAFAARLAFAGAPLLSAVTMVVIPTYSSRLSFAFLPALLGNAVDLALILYLFVRLPQITERRAWLAGSVLVVGSYLAYVSGVLNTTLLLGVLAVLVFYGSEGDGRARCWRAIATLGMGLVGGLIAFILFYRDFLPMVLDLLGRIIGGVEGVESRYPIRSFLEMTVSRTWSFFGWWYPALAGLGMYLAFRKGVPRLVLSAWLGTYFVLLLGRAKIPDIFLHGHETLFVAPLICLMSGVALSVWVDAGRTERLMVAAAVLTLAVVGLVDQWSFFADQLANAR